MFVSLTSRSSNHGTRKRRLAFSLLELLAVVTILGVVAAMILPRVNLSTATAKNAANDKNIADINAAIERFYLETLAFPTAIADLETNEYFPDGVPTNPVTGAAYQLDTTTHRVKLPGGGGGK